MRSENLNSCGIKVLRFTNSQVTNDLENVIASILQELSTQPQAAKTKSPTHLPLQGQGVRIGLRHLLVRNTSKVQAPTSMA